MIIAPSILSADFSNLEREVRAIDSAGADWVHLDVMDGSFVPNITFGMPIIKAIRKHTSLPFDVHLMIDNPASRVDDFIAAGADIITIHYEADRHIERTVSYIKSKGVKAGIALNPGTPISLLEDIICELDMVLIMSVNPGFAAQKLIEFSFEKVEKLSNLAKEKNENLIIQVDGGVNDKTAISLKLAGANCLVAGSYIFGSKDYKAAIASLK